MTVNVLQLIAQLDISACLKRGPNPQAVPLAILTMFPLCGPNLDNIPIIFTGNARQKCLKSLLTVWLGCSWPDSAIHPAGRLPSTDWQTSPSQHWQTSGTGAPSERRWTLLEERKSWFKKKNVWTKQGRFKKFGHVYSFWIPQDLIKYDKRT